MSGYAETLASIMRADPWRMKVLAAVRALQLPDCWTGAGFVRSYVWDYLSGHKDAFKVEDVDVVYYDPADISEATEKSHDRRLSTLMQDVPWSCKNQARMHLKAGLPAAYRDTGDGLAHWTETATAVAVRLGDDGSIHILAPFGLDDLFQKVVRPTPLFKTRMDAYRARLAAKKWDARWPDLRFIEE